MTLRILVTGASGYAGGAIAAALRAHGAEVITAGRRPDDGVALDLADPGAVAALRLPANVDACVHAAAMHEVQCRADPYAAYVVNVAGSRALAQACQRAGVGRLIYVSTFHVFGDPAGDLDELAAPRPVNDYGLTHLQAEEALAVAGRAGGPVLDVFRPANLYGEPADWGRFNRWTLAPFDFCRQAMQDGMIRLHARGAAVRNYCSVTNLAAHVCARLASGQSLPLTHLAGTDWRIADLADLAAECAASVLNRPVAVRYGAADETPAPAIRFMSRHAANREPGNHSAMAGFLRATLIALKDRMP